MRLAEGMDLRRSARLAGRELDARAVEELRGMGFVETDADRLRVTAAGRPVLNAILRALA